MNAKLKSINNQINKFLKGGALLSNVLNWCSTLLAGKRISLCPPKEVNASGSNIGPLATPVGRGMRASMTVEACFVLPFFLFAFLNIISIQEIYRLQGNMSAAIHNTEKEMAVYGYGYKAISGGAAGTAESSCLTYFYAANKVKNILGTDYLDSAPISGGAAAIRWIRSEVMKTDDCIDLVAEYRVKPAIALIGYNEFGMYNRLRTRAWTGYDNAKACQSGNDTEELVYITPSGTVYHRSRGCSFLKLSIAAVSLEFLEKERNSSGAIYYPCEECGGGSTNTVYITNHGNRYHTSLGCSKLKRTIQAVPISQTGGRSACSKCGFV